MLNNHKTHEATLTTARDLLQYNNYLCKQYCYIQTQNHQGKEPVKLQVGQEVLLDNPTKRKLDPCWTGPQKVTELTGPLNVKIVMNDKQRVVHVNRVRPFLRPDSSTVDCESACWTMESSIISVLL